MARMNNICDQQIQDILQSNSSIKQSVFKAIQEYLEYQNRFLDKVGTNFDQLNAIKSVADIFLSNDAKVLLNEFKPFEKVQLAICGYNGTGKTTLVHELLGCGKFLPTGIGPVSACIVKFSYIPASEACLIRHTSELDPDMIQEKIDLSIYFDGSMTKNHAKFRETVKKYVARPPIDPMSDEFAKWASHLIEIRIPSSFLQLGIDIYDTPGFLGQDPPILAKNLLKLVGSIRPSLVYLYDNPAVSDDSRKSFEQLKLVLHHHFHDTSIFFLNTKADILTIRNDNEDEQEDIDDDFLLNHEREKRYKLLLNVNELSSTISNGKHLSLDQCNCFDIFTSQGSTDPLETKMKKHAINSIIRFAAEHDLCDTKQIINVVLGTIDDFFDFVLIMNRRSVDEWKKIHDHALEWSRTFFVQYQNNIDYIVNETIQRFPTKFNQKCREIAQRALSHCKTTWWKQFYTNDPYNSSSSAVFEYINMTVKMEVIQPILDEITLEISYKEKEKLDQSIKNELLMAAYREVMMINGDYGLFYSRSKRALGIQIGMIVTIPFILINAAVKYISLLGRSKNHVENKIKKIEEKHMDDIIYYLNDLQKNVVRLNIICKYGSKKIVIDLIRKLMIIMHSYFEHSIIGK
jgi:ABC-type multidrug transport system fused ATPase/permease subunit